MTLNDMDWGNAEWDVDSKAETLNKSLFGKKKIHNKVKADLNLSKKDVCEDSDDDDDEKLSKKAKKKLKERKRKENKRNKIATATSHEENGQESNVQSEEKLDNKVEINSKKSQAKTATKKQKAKTSDSKLVPNSVVKDKKITPAAGLVSEEKGVKKKRKMSPNEQCKETDVKVKQSKREDQNSVLDNEGEPKKKRKRKKKKKPNSKKNKYKHLGLKSKSVVNEDLSVSDSESGEEDETIHRSKNDVFTSEKSVLDNNVKLGKTKKRKNSLSAEEILPAKKSKKVDKSDNVSLTAKTKKDKKNKRVVETDDTEEKKCDVGDEVHANITKKKKKKAKSGDDQSKLDSRDEPNSSNDLKVSHQETNLKKSKKERKAKNVTKANSELEVAEPLKSSPFFTSTHGSELQQKMVDKLASARFRFINEQLYTIKGGEAFRMFHQDKTLMAAYNTGFQGQVKQWSVNPLDVIIKQLNTKSANLKVADFGCGEARLSASVPQKVHSFDLYALNKRVTVCDMAKTPLDSGSMDVAVFCLSLMGTNLNDYVLEANRILKDGGLLKIAEVVSRFTVPNHFINAVTSMGFRAVNTRELSAMFYLMDFKKVKNLEKTSKQTRTISLKPCLYKKR